jgi:hypothetical protein
MEVLISIGVVAIGLLGVVALIPVAQYRAMQGSLEDRKAVFGKRAVREFHIRGMNDPGTDSQPNWLGPPTWRPFPNANVFRSGQLLRQAYCLDPRMVAAHPSTAYTFPAAKNVPSAVQMPRITLRAQPPPYAAEPMGLALAEDIFVLQDDLVFDIPEQAELPPLQRYFTNAQGQGAKRLAEGRLSWLATIVPDPVLRGSDYYLLSVAILHNRVVDPTEEMVALVTQSLGPGQITLQDVSGADPPSKYGVKDIRTGDWLLIAQVLVPDQRLPANERRARPFFRWTKVIGADEKRNVAGLPREFMLSLSDMNFNPPAQTPRPHAIYMRGVVAVYEKSIRLEHSSLWSMGAQVTGNY